MLDKKIALKQIDSVFEKWNEVKKTEKTWKGSRYFGADTLTIQSVTTLCLATIDRLAHKVSRYHTEADRYLSMHKFDESLLLDTLMGVLSALRADYEAGYLKSVEELIHADIFADFLEMAQHLLSQGYKDPAAVMAGSVLEQHLRQLCEKHAIDITHTKPSGDIIPKKASRLNDDLAKEDIYPKLDQKSITAWLDLRNSAAHGHYEDYSKDQVALMIQGIRDFLTRFPA